MNSSSDLVNALTKELKTKVRSDKFTAYCYETDIGRAVRRTPIAVAFPENSEDVSIILKLANEYRIPVTVRGGGTTVAGETVANDSILIDTKKMNKLIDVDANQKIAYLESGMTWFELYDALKRYNLSFNVAPASATCTVGGTISVGGVDLHSYKYGSSADQVEEIEVVLAEGEIKICNSKKNSEIFQNILYGNGLIGVITKLKMKISNHPGKSYESWFAYPDRKSALQDYYRACENNASNGIMYIEMMHQPIIRMENFGEPIEPGKMKGKLITTIISNDFYLDHAHDTYSHRIRHNSLLYMFRMPPISLNFIDVVFPDRKYISESFDYADKLWKNVRKQGVKQGIYSAVNHKLCLALRVKENAQSRPFSPIPSGINNGDLIFGAYFGTNLVFNDYSNYLKYNNIFNFEMINKTAEIGGMLYKYCGDVKESTKKMFSEERWAYLVSIKKKYDPNNILNRGVLFE